jgi:Multicopper oxidase
MSERFHPTRNRGLRRMLTSAAAALLVVAGGAVSAAPAAAATPTPRPKTSPSSAIPKSTATPKPAPATHAAPTKPPVTTKAAARKVATKNAPLAALGGPGACTATGSTVSADLYALPDTGQPGTPIAGVPFWGFSTTSTGPSLPGPTLYACQADTLQLTLHNQLPNPPAGVQASSSLSIEIPGANTQPDTSGIAPGSTRQYTFSGLAPGSYIYEAGPTPGGARQVAMGLSGLLIVRPTGYSATNLSAYGTAASQFVDESTLVVSEIDQDFNQDPFTKDLHEYNPNLFLVNGQAFNPAAPSTIPVAPGDTLLLHEADLGLREHAMTVLGHRQTVLADDSHQLTNPQDLATKYLTPGQVSDSIVTVDPTAQTGAAYPIFDSGFHLSNDTNGGLGGMMAELSVATGVGGSNNGPTTSNVSVTPSTNPGQLNALDPNSGAITVSATFTSPVGLSAAEWFVDNIGASGSVAGARPIPGVSGTSATVTFTIAWPDFLAALAQDDSLAGLNGDHVIWVHAQDTTGTWGTAAGDVETVNVKGPGTSKVNLHSTPTNDHNPNDIDGSNDMVIWATGMSSLSDWTVLGAFACVDSTSADCAGGTRYDLFTNPTPTGPKYNNNYSPAANYPSLPGVSYPDQTSACTPIAQPGPPSSPPAPVNEPGGGNVVSACGVIPQAALAKLAAGTHYVFVRSYEGQNFNKPSGSPVPAGWGVRTGAAMAQKFVIDRTGPATGNLTVSPNPNNGYQNGPGNLGFLDSVQVTATFNDTSTGGSDIASGELFLLPTPVPAGSPAGTLPRCDGTTPPSTSIYGTGATMIPTTGKWSGTVANAYAYVPLSDIRSCQEGTVVLWVHGKDAAGNWGPATSVTLTLDRTKPVITALTASTTAGTTTLTLSANDPTSNGASSNIAAIEWFTGADPGPGNATAVPGFTPRNPVTAYSFVPGTGHFTAGTVIYVRIKDAAGNWSAVSQVTA